MIRTSHLLRHGRVTLAAALMLGALVAHAQGANNLIQNGDFEASPPANFGNNIGHSIAPWVVGTGNSPNVVKVDGPGGYDYGNLGPESDASGAGAGVKQHYLDIANGANDFYQTFTVPACQAAPQGTQATVTFGGYFSGRGNAGGQGTITLRQGTGTSGTVIQAVTGTVAPGNSKTDPWIHVQGTATLVFGQTFSYIVAMPNELNFDNAHLTIESDPCNPPPPPPPNSTGCLSVTPDVKCGPNGTIIVTLNGSNFTSDQITLAAQTSGVTVSPPQQAWAPSTTWTISGATPGQALTLIANATKTGGGSETGTDQCCSAEITITVPDCPPPSPPFDIGIAKIGEVNLANPNGPYNFTIGVRNLAGPISTAMPLTFTDVVPAGMTFTSVTPTNYTCVPVAPVSGGTTLTCTYNGPFPIASGQVIGSVAIVADGGNGPYTNCASLGQSDSDSSNDKACATVQKDYGNLTVVKEVENNTQPKVSTSGLVYPVTVTCGSAITTLSLIDGMPQTVGPIPFNTFCSVVEGTPPMPSGACVAGQLTWTKSLMPPNDVQIVSGTNTVVRVRNKLDCAPSDGGNGSLVVTKTVVNKVIGAPFPTGLTYPVTVTCGSMVTSLTLTENVPQTVNNIPTPASCHVEEGTMPTVSLPCAMMGQVPTWSTAYLPTQDSNVTGPNTPVTVQNTIECKPPSVGGFKLTVNKVVTNRTNPQIPTTGTIFAISASCASGMSPAVVTPMPLADGGSQSITGLANGTSCTITETLPPPPPTIAVSCLPNYSPVWSTTPVPPVSINNGDATATVQNFLDCVQDGGGTPAGYVLVNKFIDNQTNDKSGAYMTALNALVFPITVTCNGNDTLLNISPPTPQAVHAVPVGQLCNVAEGTRPSAPPSSSACSNGQVPTWGAIDYSATPAGLPTPVTSGQGPAIHVKNTLVCAQPMPPPVCKPPMVPGNLPGQCVCPPGMVQTGGGCIVVTPPPRCYPPMVAGTLPGQCVCPPGTVLLNGTCVTPPPPACKPPMVAGPVKGQCVCPPGTKQQGARCIETVVCRSPARPNAKGTACTCPPGMTLKGNTCVETERKRPAVSTDDVIRVVPGLIGPGGFGGGGGSRGGGDKGGGGAGGGNGGGGYKPPGVR